MHKKILFIAVACCTVICVSIISFFEFKTFNIPKVVTSIIEVSIKDNYCIELCSEPQKVIIASANNSKNIFFDYLEKNGYIINHNEQMGSIYSVSKNGVDEHISYSSNGYYSKWIWE